MSYKVSRNINTNNKSNKTAQPFCKMCFDAKREDYNTHFLKDFSGPKPVVLCPYLLALKCNYCKEQGHTVSYCEVLKKNEASRAESKSSSQNGKFFIMRTSSEKQQTVVQKPAPSVSQKNKVSMANHFALLSVDDDDDACWEQPKKRKGGKQHKQVRFEEDVAVDISPALEEEIPPLIDEDDEDIAEPIIVTSTGPSWANIVAMPPPKKQLTVKRDIPISVAAVAEPAAYEKPMPVFVNSSSSNTKSKSIEKYFYEVPDKTRSWADDSSDDDGGW